MKRTVFPLIRRITRFTVLLFTFFLIVCRPASRRQLKALRKESTPGELLMQVRGGEISRFSSLCYLTWSATSNVPDLEPDPDMYVLRPRGSGSVIYLFGSGSFHQQTKKLGKTLILWLLCDFVSLKNDVNVPSKRFKLKILERFFVGVLKISDEKSRIWIR
jgi:hypothetical protein